MGQAKSTVYLVCVTKIEQLLVEKKKYASFPFIGPLAKRIEFCGIYKVFELLASSPLCLATSPQ